MLPTKPVSACPHCGGESGYQTNVMFKAVRVARWNGADTDTDNYELVSETNPKCSDCGKPVRSLFK